MDVNKKVVQCRKYPITYTLVTKQVKNINMRISSKGEVVVSANPFVPMDKIDDFVSSKVSWIVKHQKSMQERSQKSMIDDKHIILFGNSLKIRKTTGKYNHVSYDKDTLYVQCREQADPEKVIRQFLDKLCRDVFLDIATLTFRSLSDYHLEFPDVKIRDMKSRWGSCNNQKKRIGLNVQLIKSDIKCIDQVVLHELAHFVSYDHSDKFYAVLNKLMPDWKERKEILETKYNDGIR